MRNEDKEKFYLPMFLFAVAVVAVNVYWFAYDLFFRLGLTTPVVQDFFAKIYSGHFLDHTYTFKFWALGFIFFCYFVKAGKTLSLPWKTIIGILAAGLVLFFFPYLGSVLYIITTVSGFGLTILGVSWVGRKVHGLNTDVNDDNETFEQCDELIEDEMSVNIPIRYQWKKKLRDGWINVVMPHSGCMITGVPGTGKSYAIYGYFLETMVKKGYCFNLYDFKFPELSTELYNLWLLHKDDKKADGTPVYPVTPTFHVINFDDPRFSQRCNPIHPRYISDPADTSEIADLIMRNVSNGEHGKDDFFSMSAKVFVDCLIWFLRCFEHGRYCDFPHLIELMGRNYKAVFKMLTQHEDLRIKMQPFANALSGKAMEQLMGQIASAQIPLARFASPALYWVLSGDDFSLDANNPEDPKFICFGNNPDRQTIYGTTLALYTSRIFKTQNHPRNKNGLRNLKCAIMLDEMPTIYLKDVDKVIATARSNKVAVIMGAQDESQLIRDYDEKDANVIFGVCGTHISSRVNGSTAKKMSEAFGKEFREQQSETTGGENDTLNRSFQLQERLPQSRIQTLSQGEFCGWVADRVGKEVKKKLFCGHVVVPKTRNAFLANLKPIPSQKNPAFREDEIEAEVRRRPKSYCLKYIRKDYLEEEWQKYLKDETYDRVTEGNPYVDMEVARRYNAMTREQKIALLDKIVEREIKAHVEEVVQTNYNNIKNDILIIFAAEGINEFEEESKKARPGQTTPWVSMPAGTSVNDIAS